MEKERKREREKERKREKEKKRKRETEMRPRPCSNPQKLPPNQDFQITKVTNAGRNTLAIQRHNSSNH
jgi:hypothetical protein